MFIGMLCIKSDDDGGRDYKDSIIKALLKCMSVTMEYEGHSGTAEKGKIILRTAEFYDVIDCSEVL